MYYCHHCGNALSDDARFCGRCGTPRQAVAPTDWSPTTQPQSGETQVLSKMPPYTPAPVHTVAPEKPAKAPMSGALKLLICLGAVAMLVVVVVVVNATSGPVQSADSNATVAGPAVSQNETCAREILAEAALMWADPNAGVVAVVNAIGNQNPQWNLALIMVQAIGIEVPKSGVSGAAPVLQDRSRGVCNQWRNPVLTAGQLDSLKQLAPAATDLNEITIVG
jgi:hypothetical protein